MNNHEIETKRGRVSIRTTTDADMAAYRALRLEGLRSAPTAFGSDYETSAVQPDSFWYGRIRQREGEQATFVVDAGGELAGMAVITREDGVKERHNADIYSVFVHPAWRGQGLADALIHTCVDWARQHGIRNVKLSVNTNNTPAIRCYTRCGFRVYGVEPEVIFWDGVYYDELLMVRKL